MKTEKRKRIDGVYKVLALYEDVLEKDNIVTISDYLSYVKKLSVMYNGLGNEEFYGLLNGLYKEGSCANIEEVKSIVFHLINLIDRGGV